VVVQKKIVVKVEVVEPKDAELENINARHTKDVPNIVVIVAVARPAEDAVNLGIDNFLIILYIMGRTRHTRKRHTRRKHKRKRTRRRRTRRRTRRVGGTALSTHTQIFGGGYKEGLYMSLVGGAKSTYGVSDYPPGFSKFIRRDKRMVDKMKRKSRKHKRKRRKH